MMIILKRQVCCYLTTIAVAIALVFSTLNMGVATSFADSPSQSVGHFHTAFTQSETFIDHLPVNQKLQNETTKHTHGHNPDHSHEVPAPLGHSKISFKDINQYWCIFLGHNLPQEHLSDLERPPRALSYV